MLDFCVHFTIAGKAGSSVGLDDVRLEFPNHNEHGMPVVTRGTQVSARVDPQRVVPDISQSSKLLTDPRRYQSRVFQNSGSILGLGLDHRDLVYLCDTDGASEDTRLSRSSR